MERRPSLLKKMWRKLRGAKPAPAAKSSAPARKVVCSLESLEGRISPAALINPTTLMYRDFDGDVVTVKFTKSIFTSSSSTTNLANANNVFKFNTGTVDATKFDLAHLSTLPEQQLLLVDLTQAPTSSGKNLAIGTGITISAVKAGSGNGFVDVGHINATGLPLTAVSVSGDLGQIDAGATTAVPGGTSLKVKSLGVRGPAETQPAGGDLVSNITGALGSLTVSGDVHEATVIVANGAGPGKIGTVTIGGSLKGRGAAMASSDATGEIVADGDIAAVKIGKLATDGIVGGGGTDSG